MQSHYQLDPFRTFLARYQSALVVLMGFACAFLLGLLLWSVASASLPGVAPLDLFAAPELPVAKESPAPAGAEVASVGAGEGAALAVVAAGLAPVFTPEVDRWQAEIVRWAADWESNPPEAKYSASSGIRSS